MDKDTDGYKKYFEILELPTDSSLADIKTAYEKLKKLYSMKSMATHPLEEEFGEEEKLEIVTEVEEAYKILLRYVVEKDRVKRETIKAKKDKLEDTAVEKDITEVDALETKNDDTQKKKTKDFDTVKIKEYNKNKPTIPKSTVTVVPPVPLELPEPVEAAKDFSKAAAVKGRTLKKLREKLGIGVHEIAVKTKISYKILVNIELERFEKLPEAGYLRWHVMSYAKALSLNPRKIADEYMKRYRHWKSKQEETTEDNEEC